MMGAEQGTSRPQPSARMDWILLFAGFLFLMCMVAGGFGILVLNQSQQQAGPIPALQTTEDPAAYVPQTLPPTWTPTVTQPPRPSATFIPGWETPTPGPVFKIAGPSLGLSAPDFILNDLSGNQVSMSNYNGQAVLLLFWATWCPHCLNEIASVQSVYQKYKDNGFVVLAIDVGESTAKARNYRSAHGLTFVILNDSSRTVATHYHVTGFPTHFFVAPNGQISSIAVGEVNQAGLDSKVKALLSLAP